MMRTQLFVLMASVLLLPGCAQWMAIKQPKHLECRTTVLVPGMDRDTIIGCVGIPLLTDRTSDEQLHETYVYKDGGQKNHPASKTIRVVLYTAADVFTLFLAQILTMPMEAFILDESTFQSSVDYTRDRSSMWRARYLVERGEAGDIVRTFGNPTSQIAEEDDHEPPPAVSSEPPPEP